MIVVWTCAPLVWAASVSLKLPIEVYTDPSVIPSNPTLDAYTRVLERPELTRSFLNSVIVGVGTVVVTITTSMFAAYAFARFDFRLRHFLLLLMLLPKLIPGVALMVPLFRLAAFFGVLNTYLALIVVYSGVLLPVATWLLMGFIQRLPRELEEAAQVDGASLWGRLRYVVLPLAYPAVVTIAVLALREAWTEFTLNLALSTSSNTRTMPYVIYLMQDTVGLTDLPLSAAYAILSILPLVFFYLRIEKYIVGGLTQGSLK